MRCRGRELPSYALLRQPDTRHHSSTSLGGSAGAGGGGSVKTTGTVNTGGGGGGSGSPQNPGTNPIGPAAAGGSGIVLIAYPS